MSGWIVSIEKNYAWWLALALLVSTLLRVQHLNKDLVSIHVWRQTQTQATIDAFYREDANIFHPKRLERGHGDGLFRIEFPLMQWSIAGLYHVFGPHLLVTRLAMLICAFASILGMFALLQVLFKKRWLSLAGAWAFTFSPTFYYHGINPMPDNLALALGIWGLYGIARWADDTNGKYWWLGNGLVALSALVKLPFILYFLVPGILWLQGWNTTRTTGKYWLRMMVLIFAGVLPVVWYAWVIPGWGKNPVVKGMLANETTWSKLFNIHASNAFSTLPELLLNYGSVLFFLAGVYFFFAKKYHQHERVLPWAVLGVALLGYYFFEANAIEDVHDYYLYPFYPLLFVLVGFGAWHLVQVHSRISVPLSIGLLALVPVTCYLRMKDRWSLENPGFNKDLLVHKTALRNAVPADALVVAGNDHSHFIYLYHIDKKGWVFEGDHLPAHELQSMIQNGARYLYTDSESIQEQNPDIKKFVKHLVTQQGSVRVYALKAGQ